MCTKKVKKSASFLLYNTGISVVLVVGWPCYPEDACLRLGLLSFLHPYPYPARLKWRTRAKNDKFVPITKLSHTVPIKKSKNWQCWKMTKEMFNVKQLEMKHPYNTKSTIVIMLSRLSVKTQFCSYEEISTRATSTAQLQESCSTPNIGPVDIQWHNKQYKTYSHYWKLTAEMVCKDDFFCLVLVWHKT
jgi:hypothetical protein